MFTYQDVLDMMMFIPHARYDNELIEDITLDDKSRLVFTLVI